MSIFDFEMKALDGSVVPLGRFRGQVLLIVNVASKCGFTPQYEGLEALYQKYKDRGFAVLGFPCNQFLWEESGDGASCRLKYGVTFPVFAKIKVNGRHTDSLYRFLKSRARGWLGTKFVLWNFTKFLIDRDGLPIRRYNMWTKPQALEQEIERIL
jgi:glutathione peroxidase